MGTGAGRSLMTPGPAGGASSLGAPGEVDVLIVDDEALARKGIRTLVESRPNVRGIREASSAGEAVPLIEERRPDLVFLDVQMPREDGFGVIARVGAERMPPVVFVTAYDTHAVRAFEAHAVDYLLKPVEPARFHDAFDRACQAALQVDMSSMRSALASLLPLVRRAGDGAAATSGAAAAVTSDERLRIRHEGKIVLLDRREIDWIESAGNYARIHVRGGTLLHRATMDELQALLGAAFVRIRRSTLVRAAAVRYCEAEGKGCYVVVLHDKTRLVSSRYYRAELSALVDG